MAQVAASREPPPKTFFLFLDLFFVSVSESDVTPLTF